MMVDFGQIPQWVDRPIAECVSYAAKEYKLPPLAILLVMRAENGKLGDAIRNVNGTYDLGPMQVNSSWLKALSPYGVTAWHLSNDLCTNIRTGSWRLKSEIVRVNGDVWKGIGNYHSRTPKFHNRYISRINEIIYTWVDNGSIQQIKVK